nr:polyprotein AB [Macrobrachium flavivirus 1]
MAKLEKEQKGQRGKTQQPLKQPKQQKKKGGKGEGAFYRKVMANPTFEGVVLLSLWLVATALLSPLRLIVALCKKTLPILILAMAKPTKAIDIRCIETCWECAPECFQMNQVGGKLQGNHTWVSAAYFNSMEITLVKRCPKEGKFCGGDLDEPIWLHVTPKTHRVKRETSDLQLDATVRHSTFNPFENLQSWWRTPTQWVVGVILLSLTREVLGGKAVAIVFLAMLLMPGTYACDWIQPLGLDVSSHSDVYASIPMDGCVTGMVEQDPILFRVKPKDDATIFSLEEVIPKTLVVSEHTTFTCPRLSFVDCVTEGDYCEDKTTPLGWSDGCFFNAAGQVCTCLNLTAPVDPYKVVSSWSLNADRLPTVLSVEYKGKVHEVPLNGDTGFVHPALGRVLASCDETDPLPHNTRIVVQVDKTDAEASMCEIHSRLSTQIGSPHAPGLGERVLDGNRAIRWHACTSEGCGYDFVESWDDIVSKELLNAKCYEGKVALIEGFFRPTQLKTHNSWNCRLNFERIITTAPYSNPCDLSVRPTVRVTPEEIQIGVNHTDLECSVAFSSPCWLSRGWMSREQQQPIKYICSEDSFVMVGDQRVPLKKSPFYHLSYHYIQRAYTQVQHYVGKSKIDSLIQALRTGVSNYSQFMHNTFGKLLGFWNPFLALVMAAGVAYFFFGRKVAIVVALLVGVVAVFGAEDYCAVLGGHQGRNCSSTQYVLRLGKFYCCVEKCTGVCASCPLEDAVRGVCPRGLCCKTATSATCASYGGVFADSCEGREIFSSGIWKCCLPKCPENACWDCPIQNEIVGFCDNDWYCCNITRPTTIKPVPIQTTTSSTLTTTTSTQETTTTSPKVDTTLSTTQLFSSTTPLVLTTAQTTQETPAVQTTRETTTASHKFTDITTENVEGSLVYYSSTTDNYNVTTFTANITVEVTTTMTTQSAEEEVCGQVGGYVGDCDEYIMVGSTKCCRNAQVKPYYCRSWLNSVDKFISWMGFSNHEVFPMGEKVHKGWMTCFKNSDGDYTDCTAPRHVSGGLLPEAQPSPNCTQGHFSVEGVPFQKPIVKVKYGERVWNAIIHPMTPGQSGIPVFQGATFCGVLGYGLKTDGEMYNLLAREEDIHPTGEGFGLDELVNIKVGNGWILCKRGPLKTCWAPRHLQLPFPEFPSNPDCSKVTFEIDGEPVTRGVTRANVLGVQFNIVHFPTKPGQSGIVLREGSRVCGFLGYGRQAIGSDNFMNLLGPESEIIEWRGSSTSTRCSYTVGAHSKNIDISPICTIMQATINKHLCGQALTCRAYHSLVDFVVTTCDDESLASLLEPEGLCPEQHVEGYAALLSEQDGTWAVTLGQAQVKWVNIYVSFTLNPVKTAMSSSHDVHLGNLPLGVTLFVLEEGGATDEEIRSATSYHNMAQIAWLSPSSTVLAHGTGWWTNTELVRVPAGSELPNCKGGKPWYKTVERSRTERQDFKSSIKYLHARARKNKQSILYLVDPDLIITDWPSMFQGTLEMEEGPWGSGYQTLVIGHKKKIDLADCQGFFPTPSKVGGEPVTRPSDRQPLSTSDHCYGDCHIVNSHSEAQEEVQIDITDGELFMNSAVEQEMTSLSDAIIVLATFVYVCILVDVMTENITNYYEVRLRLTFRELDEAVSAMRDGIPLDQIVPPGKNKQVHLQQLSAAMGNSLSRSQIQANAIHPPIEPIRESDKLGKEGLSPMENIFFICVPLMPEVSVLFLAWFRFNWKLAQSSPAWQVYMAMIGYLSVHVFVATQSFVFVALVLSVFSLPEFYLSLFIPRSVESVFRTRELTYAMGVTFYTVTKAILLLYARLAALFFSSAVADPILVMLALGFALSAMGPSGVLIGAFVMTPVTVHAQSTSNRTSLNLQHHIAETSLEASKSMSHGSSITRNAKALIEVYRRQPGLAISFWVTMALLFDYLTGFNTVFCTPLVMWYLSQSLSGFVLSQQTRQPCNGDILRITSRSLINVPIVSSTGVYVDGSILTTSHAVTTLWSIFSELGFQVRDYVCYEGEVYNLMFTDNDISSYGEPAVMVPITEGETVNVFLSKAGGKVKRIIGSPTPYLGTTSWTLPCHDIVKGMSGSPVLNSEGKVAGLVTAKVELDGFMHLVFSTIPCISKTMRTSRQGSFTIHLKHPGAGKTRVDIKNICDRAEKAGRKVLVLAPTRVVARENYAVLGGALKCSDATQEERQGTSPVIMTHQGFYKLALQRNSFTYDVVVVDEGHYENSRPLIRLFDQSCFREKHLLTATWHANGQLKTEQGSNFSIADSVVPKTKSYLDHVEDIIGANPSIQRWVVFCPSAVGTNGAEECAQRFQNKNMEAVSIYRAKYGEGRKEIAKHAGPLIICTTNISEMGANYDVDGVIMASWRVLPVQKTRTISDLGVRPITMASYVQQRGRVGRRRPGSAWLVKDGELLNELIDDESTHLYRDCLDYIQNHGMYAWQTLPLTKKESQIIDMLRSLKFPLEHDWNRRTTPFLMAHGIEDVRRAGPGLYDTSIGKKLDAFDVNVPELWGHSVKTGMFNGLLVCFVLVFLSAMSYAYNYHGGRQYDLHSMCVSILEGTFMEMTGLELNIPLRHLVKHLFGPYITLWKLFDRIIPRQVISGKVPLPTLAASFTLLLLLYALFSTVKQAVVDQPSSFVLTPLVASLALSWTSLKEVSASLSLLSVALLLNAVRMSAETRMTGKCADRVYMLVSIIQPVYQFLLGISMRVFPVIEVPPLPALLADSLPVQVMSVDQITPIVVMLQAIFLSVADWNFIIELARKAYKVKEAGDKAGVTTPVEIFQIVPIIVCIVEVFLFSFVLPFPTWSTTTVVVVLFLVVALVYVASSWGAAACGNQIAGSAARRAEAIPIVPRRAVPNAICMVTTLSLAATQFLMHRWIGLAGYVFALSVFSLVVALKVTDSWQQNLLLAMPTILCAASEQRWFTAASVYLMSGASPFWRDSMFGAQHTTDGRERARQYMLPNILAAFRRKISKLSSAELNAFSSYDMPEYDMTPDEQKRYVESMAGEESYVSTSTSMDLSLLDGPQTLFRLHAALDPRVLDLMEEVEGVLFEPPGSKNDEFSLWVQKRSGETLSLSLASLLVERHERLKRYKAMDPGQTKNIRPFPEDLECTVPISRHVSGVINKLISDYGLEMISETFSYRVWDLRASFSWHKMGSNSEVVNRVIAFFTSKFAPYFRYYQTLYRAYTLTSTKIWDVWYMFKLKYDRPNKVLTEQQYEEISAIYDDLSRNLPSMPLLTEQEIGAALNRKGASGMPPPYDNKTLGELWDDDIFRAGFWDFVSEVRSGIVTGLEFFHTMGKREKKDLLYKPRRSSRLIAYLPAYYRLLELHVFGSTIRWTRDDLPSAVTHIPLVDYGDLMAGFEAYEANDVEAWDTKVGSQFLDLEDHFFRGLSHDPLLVERIYELYRSPLILLPIYEGGDYKAHLIQGLGKRMSGTYVTYIANTVTNTVLNCYRAKRAFSCTTQEVFSKLSFFISGDDLVIAGTLENMQRLAEQDVHDELGFNLKGGYKPITENFEEIDFCSHHYTKVVKKDKKSHEILFSKWMPVRPIPEIFGRARLLVGALGGELMGRWTSVERAHAATVGRQLLFNYWHLRDVRHLALGLCSVAPENMFLLGKQSVATTPKPWLNQEKVDEMMLRWFSLPLNELPYVRHRVDMELGSTIHVKEALTASRRAAMLDYYEEICSECYLVGGRNWLDAMAKYRYGSVGRAPSFF